jgi:large subunit ribosomal protein L1
MDMKSNASNNSEKSSKYGKRYDNAASKIEACEYELEKGLEVLKSTASAKFDETIEVTFNLGVDPRHADQAVRGVVSLPKGTGKKVRVAVIANEAKVAEAKEAGADMAGGDELINDIKSGAVDPSQFDRIIATPDMMGKCGAIARVLGPKGLMPNPKLGTVTDQVAQAVRAASGSVEYRVEKNGIIHVGVGKVSFSVKDLLENVAVLAQAIQKAKPQGAKGTYMKSVYMSTTMGPSLKLSVSSLYAS